MIICDDEFVAWRHETSTPERRHDATLPPGSDYAGMLALFKLRCSNLRLRARRVVICPRVVPL
ncbi:MAG: hypothetical protein Rhirs2KO_17560 [Rhizobiaceae bacterium]